MQEQQQPVRKFFSAERRRTLKTLRVTESLSTPNPTKFELPSGPVAAASLGSAAPRAERSGASPRGGGGRRRGRKEDGTNLPTESISRRRCKSRMLWISLCASRSISSCGISASFKDTHTHTHRGSARSPARRSAAGGWARGFQEDAGCRGARWDRAGERFAPGSAACRSAPAGLRHGSAEHLGAVGLWAAGLGARRNRAASPRASPAPSGSPPAEPPAEVCPNGLKVRGGPGSTGAGRVPQPRGREKLEPPRSAERRAAPARRHL